MSSMAQPARKALKKLPGHPLVMVPVAIIGGLILLLFLGALLAAALFVG